MIKLAYAENCNLMRNGVMCMLMSRYKDIRFILSCNNGQELLQGLARLPEMTFPDLCLLGLDMPVLNGPNTILRLREVYPELPVLVLSRYDNEHMVVKMLRYGAKGYLAKKTMIEELYMAIQAVCNGADYHPQISEQRLSRKVSYKDTMELTEKEINFLQLCITEDNYKDIAVRMGIGERTAHQYRDSLFVKLHLNTKTALATYALSSGLFLP